MTAQILNDKILHSKIISAQRVDFELKTSEKRCLYFPKTLLGEMGKSQNEM